MPIESLKEGDQVPAFHLQEVHHRLKNDFQILSSLLQLKAGTFSYNPDFQQFIKDLDIRLRTIAQLNKVLTHSPNSELIDCTDFLNGLMKDLANLNSSDGRKFDLDLELEEVYLASHKVQKLAMIVIELTSNSIKHAYKHKGGLLGLCLKQGDETLIMTQYDHGAGMGSESEADDKTGLKIVKLLIDELGGRMERIVEKGTATIVTIPYDPSTSG